MRPIFQQTNSRNPVREDPELVGRIVPITWQAVPICLCDISSSLQPILLTAVRHLPKKPDPVIPLIKSLVASIRFCPKDSTWHLRVTCKAIPIWPQRTSSASFISRLLYNPLLPIGPHPPLPTPNTYKHTYTGWTWPCGKAGWEMRLPDECSAWESQEEHRVHSRQGEETCETAWRTTAWSHGIIANV